MGFLMASFQSAHWIQWPIWMDLLMIFRRHVEPRIPCTFSFSNHYVTDDLTTHSDIKSHWNLASYSSVVRYGSKIISSKPFACEKATDLPFLPYPMRRCFQKYSPAGSRFFILRTKLIDLKWSRVYVRDRSVCYWRIECAWPFGHGNDEVT
jgi:hypothetical protein